MMVRIGVSARHVHLSSLDLKILFGEGYKLTPIKNLSQKGQFACEEQVSIKGNKSQIDNVRILGPIRSNTQVEISKTDSYKLGVEPPVRNSGDLSSACEIEIIGPCGSIKRNCAIIAARHIHCTYKDAVKYGFHDKKCISLKIDGEKSGILDDVYVRIDDSYSLEVHLDTDDANAFLIKNGDYQTIINKEKK